MLFLVVLQCCQERNLWLYLRGYIFFAWWWCTFFPFFLFFIVIRLISFFINKECRHAPFGMLQLSNIHDNEPLLKAYNSNFDIFFVFAYLVLSITLQDNAETWDGSVFATTQSIPQRFTSRVLRNKVFFLFKIIVRAFQFKLQFNLGFSKHLVQFAVNVKWWRKRFQSSKKF